MDPTTSAFETNLLFYWRVLRKRWQWIAGAVFIAVAGAFVLSKISPKYYRSTAVVLPIGFEISGMSISLGEEGGGKNKSSGSSSMSLGSLLGVGGPGQVDILKSIMQSRRMADALIEQLNLKAYYGTETMGQTRAALEGETTLMVNRDKAFFITVESRDPQMAADIANAYAANLDRINRELTVTSAAKNRLFIERRLEEKRQQLAQAEEARKEFQVKNRTLLVTDKAQAALQAAGSIEEGILGLEIELARLKEYATPSHPLMNQIDAQIRALRKQSERLQQQQQNKLGLLGLDSRGFTTGFFPPIPEMPGLALEYIRLTREVKIHEAILAMLTGEYEQARIAEAKDTPTIQILDPAIPAEVKSRPRTLRNMAIAGLVALLLGIIAVILYDYILRLKHLEEGSLAHVNVAKIEAVLQVPPPPPVPTNGDNGAVAQPDCQVPQPSARRSERE